MNRTRNFLPVGPNAPMFFQGWHPFSTDTLAAAFAGAGGVGVLRMPAFPDSEALALEDGMGPFPVVAELVAARILAAESRMEAPIHWASREPLRA